MRIIGIKLHKGDPTIIKNLKESTWYPFGNYREPTEENEWSWIASDLKEQEEQEELCNQMYKSVADSDAFATQIRITVNCIVGCNGSGKSTLLELLFRIINNFAFIIIDKEWTESIPNNNPQLGHRLTEAKGFAATLFFETDGCVGSIEYTYGNLKYEYHAKTDHSRISISNQNIEKRLSTNRLKDLLRPFFYTVCTNYSIYSLNEDDYHSKTLWNEGTEGIDGNWLRGLLHKNDGYLAPITMVPYREEGGGINVRNEKKLAKQRLATLAVLFKSQQKSFMGEYEIQELVYRFNYEADIQYEKRFKKLIEEQLPFNKENNIPTELRNTWEKYLTNKILEFTKHSKKVQNSILNYLTYKTLKICLQYRTFGEKMGIRELNKQEKKRLGINKNIWIAELPIEYANTIVEEICKESQEPSHITLKVHQMLEFLKRNYYKTPEETPANIDEEGKKLLSLHKINNIKELITYNLNFDNNKSLEEKKQKNYMTYDQVFLFMPPAIFEWDVTFRRLNDRKQKEYTTLSQMSSGEKQLLQSFSYVLYHIKNLQSVKEGKFNIPFHHITLIFDEAELYYHPEYQR